MFRALLICLLLVQLVAPAGAAEKEIEVQKRFCAGMPMNQHLYDGSEVDCVTHDLAIEVDFSDHWAESIGQALHYGAILQKRPGVILVCRSDVRDRDCLNHRKRFDETMSYWNIGIMLWFCPKTARTLDGCEAKDYFGPN